MLSIIIQSNRWNELALVWIMDWKRIRLIMLHIDTHIWEFFIASIERSGGEFYGSGLWRKRPPLGHHDMQTYWRETWWETTYVCVGIRCLKLEWTKWCAEVALNYQPASSVNNLPIQLSITPITKATHSWLETVPGVVKNIDINPSTGTLLLAVWCPLQALNNIFLPYVDVFEDNIWMYVIHCMLFW